MKPSTIAAIEIISEIRLARTDDLSAVVELLGQQLREHEIHTGLDQIRGVIENVLRDSRWGFVLIAIGREVNPVGVAFGTSILGIEHGGISGWIEELYVLPRFRGQGVGSLLIDEFIRVAHTRGWRVIDLEVDSGHSRVASLYARHEFEPVARTRFCRKLKL